ARHLPDGQLPDRTCVQHPGRRSAGIRGHPGPRLPHRPRFPGDLERAADGRQPRVGPGRGAGRPAGPLRVMPMRWMKIDPLTRRRLDRFRRIKRGYYSFLILTTAIVLSVFAPFLAESRALFVWHNGQAYFPTFQYLDMNTFGQAPPPAWDTG